MYVSCTAYSQPGCRPVQNRHGNVRHQCASADIFILHFEPRSCVSCTRYRSMKGDVKRNTSPSGDNPDTTARSGQPAQLRVRRTDVPAVEELQCINDVVRN